mgnify:CR=1 FL=1
MYKLKRNAEEKISMVIRVSDDAIIPFDPANTDYQQFKLDIESGIELQDTDGNKLTKAKVTAFLKTLP